VPYIGGTSAIAQCMFTSPENLSAQTAIISRNVINLLAYIWLWWILMREVRSSRRVLKAALYRSVGPDLRVSYGTSAFTVKWEPGCFIDCYLIDTDYDTEARVRTWASPCGTCGGQSVSLGLSFRRVRIVAKSAYWLCHVRPSVRSYHASLLQVT
jgi:hypothetical protein